MLVFDHVAVGVLGGVLDAVFVEPVDSVDVGEAEEWARGWLEVWVELLDDRCRGCVRKEGIYGLADLGKAGVKIKYETGAKGADNVFDVSHEIFECNKGELGLQMSEFT
jgi:hypothetical protein